MVRHHSSKVVSADKRNAVVDTTPNLPSGQLDAGMVSCCPALISSVSSDFSSHQKLRIPLADATTQRRIHGPDATSNCAIADNNWLAKRLLDTKAST